ncbi:MAG: type I-E CRISPR-associated protein Cas5/CasD [Acidobacteriota bacterium]|nr:type I-E CRISPR-associated protein Cas5/CasD [Blastocatellia bacterium]MDW8413228.1 type I-E CRISPR-associated protein Cas5/CasD [Acidobacteriota bacterium]
MPTLLIRLVGPMQSWGTLSRFSIRETSTEPSKSGVIGLLCAALGKPRDQSTIDDEEFRSIATLRMAVRVDREGIVKYDYQTAQNIAQVSGGQPKETETSPKYYLSDACFVVGLEGKDPNLLHQLNHALKFPKWQLYLGRKAFVPSLPVSFKDELYPGNLEESLLDLNFCSWQGIADGRKAEPPEHLRVVLEDPKGPEMRYDQPFSLSKRTFLPRYCSTKFINLKGGKYVSV